MEPKLKQETEAAGGEDEACRKAAADRQHADEELKKLRQELCKAFDDKVPATTDAAMHALYLDKALHEVKAFYQEQLHWELEDYRRFYEAMQQSRVYRTDNPKHWWAWSGWFLRQDKSAQGELWKQAGLFALQKGLLVAAIGGAFSLGHWFLGRDERRTQAIYQDWQVINSAQGKAGSGGRRQAIEDLYKQGESLSGLSAKGAYLEKLNLAMHEKQPWDPFDQDRSANLEGATLNGAILSDAILIRADLIETDLSGADLRDVDLILADLRRANLSYSVLKDVVLTEADLRSADLRHANLNDADLTSANLINANFSGALLSGAVLLGVDLSGVQTGNLTQQQLEGKDPPLLCKVKLTKGIKVDPNRDCKKLPVILLERYPKAFDNLADAQADVDQTPQP